MKGRGRRAQFRKDKWVLKTVDGRYDKFVTMSLGVVLTSLRRLELLLGAGFMTTEFL